GAAEVKPAADAAAADTLDFKALIAQANAAASAAEAKPADAGAAAVAVATTTPAATGELKRSAPAAAAALPSGQPAAEPSDAPGTTLADAARATAPEAGADSINKIETKAQPADNAALQATQGRPQAEAAPLGLPAGREARAETLTAAREGAAPAELHATQAPAAAAAQEIAKAATALPADKLSGRVGSPVWDQQLGQKIIFMAAGGEQSASLSLNPPDLGPLQVVLSVSNDQASAAFTSAQPEVRQALEAAMPKLREMMSEAGITLGNATVSADTSGQQQGFQQQAASAQNGGQGGRGGNGANDGGRFGAGADSEAAARPAVRRLPAGAVDTFA
ncbi:flagellar hook-length control protein FliK, partial [Rugamonas sp. CCM 8940]